MSDDQDGNDQNGNGDGSTPSTGPTTPTTPPDPPDPPAEGRIHEQGGNYYDDAGDEVVKDKNGNWVKKKQ